MADRFTEHYGFQKLGAGEVLSKNSYKFTDADRDTIDRLLFLGAEGHHHTGGATDVAAIEDPPLLTVDLTGGTLPAASRLYYKATLVDPSGFESAASPEARVDTAASIVSPSKPTDANVTPTGGTLPPGNYYYVLSAYTDFSSQETAADNAIYVSVPFSTTTNVVTLKLPQLPGGATGFNVYRRTPSGAGYFHVQTINMKSGVPPTMFTDNGNLIEDCDRFAPTVNTSLSRNSVQVSLPVDLELPAGYSWRVYRTQKVGDYTNSLIANITDGSRTFLDAGAFGTPGQPPTVGIAPGAPEKIRLTDMSEVQGRLPLAGVSAWPHEITFSFPGPLEPVEGKMTWICPFPQARLFSVRPVLGRDVEATGDVEINVMIKLYGSSEWVPVLSSPATIPAGYNDVLVDRSTADAFDIFEIQAADLLAIDIVSSDPANTDLTVVVGMYLYGWTYNTVSGEWAAPR